ncbi:MAG: alpha/beta hydrolase [Sulfurovum sp.]|nr:alpha/beta hydrolase [Sulfurovum sp.]
MIRKKRRLRPFSPCPRPQNITAKAVHIVVSDNDPWVKIAEVEEIAKYYDASLDVLVDAGHINADFGYGKWGLIEALVLQK